MSAVADALSTSGLAATTSKGRRRIRPRTVGYSCQVVSPGPGPDEAAIVFLEDEYPPGSVEEGLLDHRGPRSLTPEDQRDAALARARPDNRAG